VGLALYLSIALSFSSFISVLRDRIPDGRSILGRSKCCSCGVTINWKYNIPLLSWIFLKGRCRNCSSRIPLEILLTEIAAMILYVSLLGKFESYFELVLWFGYVTFGLSLFLIDLSHFRLPNALTLPFFAYVLIMVAIAFVTRERDLAQIWQALIMGLLNFFLYAALRVLSRGGMGLGDVKLAPTIGLVIGLYSIKIFMIASYATFVLAGIVAVALLVLKKAGMKTAIPFGPFMLAAPYLVYLFT
jgi:leader peptidase (prepilin peptidase)/N-methyltransferase